MIQCSECVFWREHRGDPEMGTCRRRAPMFVQGMVPKLDDDPGSERWAVFPETYCEQGCGEGERPFP